MARHGQGRLADAELLLQQATHLVPERASLWEAYGRLLVDMGRDEDAAAIYLKAIDLENHEGLVSVHRHRPESHLDLALVLFRLKRFSEVVEHCRAYLKECNNPPNPLAYRKLVDSLIRLKEYSQALSELQRLQTFDFHVLTENDKKWYHHLKAITYFGLSEYSEALEEIDTALQLAPQDTSLLYDRARALSRLGRLTEAIDALSVALNTNDPSSKKLARTDPDLENLRSSTDLEVATKVAKLLE